MKFLLIIGILVLAHSINSHQCYVCKLGNCTAAFPVDLNHTHIDCNDVVLKQKGHTRSPSTGCMKKTVEIEGKDLIQRDCYFGNHNPSTGCMGFYSHVEYGKMIACDVCSKDLCNQSNEINVTSIGVVMAALIACYCIF